MPETDLQGAEISAGFVIHSAEKMHLSYPSTHRRSSEDASSRKHDQLSSSSPHHRHSDAQVGILKSMERQVNQSDSQASSGSKRKKSVSIQLEEDSHSRHNSLRSPTSEEDGCNREAGTSSGDTACPDTLSEKENKHSTSNHEDESDHSVSEAGSKEKQSPSKSGDTKSRRHSTNKEQSSSDNKSRRLSISRKQIKIKPITYIVDQSCGYVTSPDISSEDEEEEKEKGVKESSAATGLQRRESTNSQTGDEVGPASLSKYDLKPSLDRHGGSYMERLKIMEKLKAVKQKMDESTGGYNRKRAARGEVKKRRARREKLEGDFSGPCRDKIEYNIEDKPSLKMPEPKPEEPKPEKPPKKPKPEKSKKEKKHPKEFKEKHRSKDRVKTLSKPPSKDRHAYSKKHASKPETKRKNHSPSIHSEDSEMTSNAKHSRKRRHRASSPVRSDQDSSSHDEAPDHTALQQEYLKMKSIWAAVFSKPKTSESEASVDAAPALLQQTSEADTLPPVPKKSRTTDESQARNSDLDLYLSDD